MYVDIVARSCVTVFGFKKNLFFNNTENFNLRPNVPINELVKVVNIMRERHGIDVRLKQEIMKISRTLIDQNYFRFHDSHIYD